MTLPPLYIALMLWTEPYFTGLTTNEDGTNTEIRCWEYEGRDYQLTIATPRQSLYANEPVTVITNENSDFCQAICH